MCQSLNNAVFLTLIQNSLLPLDYINYLYDQKPM
jgi:hypothetical protein